MKRRTGESAWPAFSDLMTVLAVTGMVTATTLAPVAEEAERQRREAEQQRLAIEKELVEVRAENDELAKNQKMFAAIQKADDLVRDFARQLPGLTLNDDQSIQFGEDLVQFQRNETQPRWQKGGKEQLNQFCTALSRHLTREFPGTDRPLSDFFVIRVEGHTDDATCPGDPGCNWRFSAQRAAKFRTLLRDSCDGAERWTIVPEGRADTLRTADGKVRRRIEVRLVPDYRKIIASAPEK